MKAQYCLTSLVQIQAGYPDSPGRGEVAAGDCAVPVYLCCSGATMMRTEPDEPLDQMLAAWSTAAYVEGQLEGGYRNRLWAVRIGGRRYAARLSPRPDSALEWEIQLLQHLRAADMIVPEVLATRDGRSRIDGLVLFSWLEGYPPASDREWRLVAD
jgi:Ser/Thr protein kinase RdoA (MazF antagonist)